VVLIDYLTTVLVEISYVVEQSYHVLMNRGYASAVSASDRGDVRNVAVDKAGMPGVRLLKTAVHAPSRPVKFVVPSDYRAVGEGNTNKCRGGDFRPVPRVRRQKHFTPRASQPGTHMTVNALVKVQPIAYAMRRCQVSS